MSMYHRKQEKLPTDSKSGAKLLARENTVHSQKKLAKDLEHMPHHKDTPAKKVPSKKVAKKK